MSEDAMGKVIAKAWDDEDYKERLKSDPKSVLSEAGVELEQDVEIHVVEDSDDHRHLVIPPRPGEGELSDESLEKVAGGTTKVTWKT